jgi:hypothetical protein
MYTISTTFDHALKKRDLKGVLFMASKAVL